MATNSVESKQPGRTLRDVISIIPDECYQRPTWLGIAYSLRDSLVYWLSLALLFSTDNVLLLIPLWVFSGLCVSALFITGHDAAHGALFKDKRLCDFFGRMLMLPSLHAFSAWCLGHNRVHHAFTIKQERDFVWHPLTIDEYKDLSPWGKFRHRIEWSAFGAGIYYLFEIWAKKMIFFTPPKKLAAEIESDKRLIWAFFFGSLVAAAVAGPLANFSLSYSLWVWFKVLVVPWLLFNYIIGATVHIHHIQPDIAWHSHGVWNKFKGQVEGTTNFTVSPILNFFFHNIFIHIPHHVDPRIPFYHLPKASDAIKRYYECTMRNETFKFSTYFKATKLCKLYDFENNVWLDYKGQKTATPTPAR